MAVHSKQYGKIVELLIGVKHWLHRFIIRSQSTKDSKLAQVAANIILIALCIEMAFVIPGLKTGLGILLDYYYIGSLYIAGLLIIYFVLRKLLKLVRIIYASIISSLVLFAIQTYYILSYMNFELRLVILGSSLLTVMMIGIGLLLGALYNSYREKMRLAIVMLALAGIGFALLTGLGQTSDEVSYVTLEEAIETTLEETAEYDEPVLPNKPIDKVYTAAELLRNPAELGPYQVQHLYYQSTSPEVVVEEHEEEKITTSAVDGSDILQDWSWSKELYWKFTEEEIPINGQLWIPDGEGPFPVVFIMHGNHLSEADSSDGYYYLGELLASHGMIVSSIDANFLNYSVWSGIVDNDQVLRAWLMLAHVYTFHELQNEQLSIDWDNVALIGHSRGGQAAAMAVDAKQWLDDSELVNILDHINIKAVIGIAPTDYATANKLAQIRNINYLTIHGTMDSDLTEFFGERQYERTTFTEPNHMKASVAIYNANHGQFNTVWGKYDQQFPSALVLNTSDLIPGEDQRIAAQIYINSFLQASFQMDEQAKALFQNYHVARAWLPNTGYVTRYSSSEMISLVSFDHEQSARQLDFDESMAVSISEIIGRNGTSKQNKALSVQWNEAYSKLSIEVDYIKPGNYDALTFSAANIDETNMSEGSSPLPISLQLHTQQDEVITFPLHTTFSLIHPAQPEFLRLNWLESTIKDGKYNGSLEPLLQSYIIPLSLIQQLSNSDQPIELADISQITFEFQSEAGELMIDNIGLVTEGGSYVKYDE